MNTQPARFSKRDIAWLILGMIIMVMVVGCKQNRDSYTMADLRKPVALQGGNEAVWELVKQD